MKKKIIAIAVSVVIVAGIVLAIVLPIVSKKAENVKNKYKVFVNVFNGGHGVGWAEQAAEDFNKTSEYYKIEIVPDISGGADIIADIDSGSPQANAYFSCDVQFQQTIYQDKLLDLTSILDMKVDGADGVTVGDKMRNKELWMQAASKNGKGCYMLPYADSYMGFVYDHDLFVEKGWVNFAPANETVKQALTGQGITFTEQGNRLVFVSADKSLYYDEGDFILTAGKDGKYGTYDDGQPENIEQWEDMLKRISFRDNKKAFIWSGKNTPYLDEIFMGLFAQYVGKDAFDTYFGFDSKGAQIELNDGTQKAITVDNGYDVYKMKGIKETFDFVNTYLNNKNDYVHSASLLGETSHHDAQNLFLLGYKNEPSNPQAGMLIDGVWWENEARPMFQTLVTQGDVDRGYGKRDYRYMLFPDLEGQKGADGEGHGSAFAVRESSAILIPKVADTEKMNVARDFVAFTMKNEYMRIFTRVSGAMRPYYYSLTDDDFANMTPFMRAIYDIYNDEENIMIVRPTLSKASSPMVYATNKNASLFPINIGGADLGTPISAVQRYPVDTICTSIQNYYTPDKWANYVTMARHAGFYN